MNVQVDVAPSLPRRSGGAPFAIVAAATGLAVVAAIAAQMGASRAQPLVGAIVILGLAYVCSTNRQAIAFRTVAWGLCFQIVFALVVLKTVAGAALFTTLGNGFNRLVSFAGVGATFVFGPLADTNAWGQITAELGPRRARVPIALQLLALIIFFPAL